MPATTNPRTLIAAALLILATNGHTTINIQDAAAATISGSAIIADFGSANLTVQSAASLTTGITRLARRTGSSADATVTGPGTLWNPASLTIAPSGTANLTIADSATLNTNSATLAQSTGSTANLTITGPGSTMNLTGALDLGAPSGTGGTATINLLDGGTLNATAATTSITNNADINLDSTTGAVVDTPTLNNDATLSGPGTIIGTLNNTGRVNLTGQTLRVQNITRNNFDGLIIGNGTLHATSIENTPSATMVFSGPTNLIDVENQRDIFGGGTGLIVSTGTGPLTFFDDVINDGEIRTNTGGFTVFLGTTSGSGTYTGTGTVVFEADFTPGSSPGISNFVGDVVFGPAARLEIEIGGLLAGSEYDQVMVANATSLAGTLDVLLTDGFVPAPGDAFEIITAASILGTFAVETLPTLPGDLEWFVNYSDTSVELISTFAGDFDIDGDVDGADFLMWQRGEVSNPPSAEDLAIWQATFGNVASPITAASTAVPEPATWLMLMLGMVALLFRREGVVS